MKKIIIVVFAALMFVALCACSPLPGNRTTDENRKINYEMQLNTGSLFVGTFQDPDTSIWYYTTSEGICPRYNTDGSFYTGS